MVHNTKALQFRQSNPNNETKHNSIKNPLTIPSIHQKPFPSRSQNPETKSNKKSEKVNKNQIKNFPAQSNSFTPRGFILNTKKTLIFNRICPFLYVWSCLTDPSKVVLSAPTIYVLKVILNLQENVDIF